jgi:hypothetical protein
VAAHIADHGSLTIELTNPHLLRAGAGDGVRVRSMDGNEAELEIDYGQWGAPDYLQPARIQLVWPEEVEGWLGASGLRLRRIFGQRDTPLDASPSFYVLAGR